jgi:hypothetical protein
MLECGCTWSANSSAEAVLPHLLSAMHHALQQTDCSTSAFQESIIRRQALDCHEGAAAACLLMRVAAFTSRPHVHCVPGRRLPGQLPQRSQKRH